MDIISAFVRAQAAERRGDKLRVFDWIKAAHLIKEHKPKRVGAGLEDDWGNTGGLIYTADGIPDREDTYTYLASIWATPQIDLDGDLIDCWRYEDETPGWNSGTYWPQEALDILNN